MQEYTASALNRGMKIITDKTQMPELQQMAVELLANWKTDGGTIPCIRSRLAFFYGRNSE